MTLCFWLAAIPTYLTLRWCFAGLGFLESYGLVVDVPFALGASAVWFVWFAVLYSIFGDIKLSNRTAALRKMHEDLSDGKIAFEEGE